MPDKIEQILRAIHILFSKGEMYHDLPDKVILSKREMFDLLEKLNYAVVEVMDQYEVTTRAKEKAKQQMEAVGQSIVDAAGKEAEDVYAASMLYTDDALNDLYALVDDTRMNLRAEYNQFENTMNDQLELIKNNQSELLEQLRALSQGQKYLDLIQEYNNASMESETDQLTDTEDEYRREEPPKKSDNHQGSDTQAAVIPEKFTQTKASGSKPERHGKTKQGEGHGNGTHGGGNNTHKASGGKKNNKTGKNSIRKIIPAGPAAEEEEDWEEAPVKQKVEVKVYTGGGVPENSIFNENALKTRKDRDREKHNKTGINSAANKAAAEDAEETAGFTAEELDAEYEQWQQKQEGTENRQVSKGKISLLDKLIGKK